MSIAAGGALLVVQLQQPGLASGPGTHSAEHHGQIVTGLTDGLVSGGHQERGGDHQNERNNSGQDLVIDVFHGGFLLKICFNEMRFVKDTLTLKEFTSFDRDAIII